MNRHAVAVTLFEVILAGGISSLIGATAVPADSPYFTLLLWGGIAAVAIGILGLVALWIFPAKERREGSIDQRVTSHNQSGGITARNINSEDDRQ